MSRKKISILGDCIAVILTLTAILTLGWLALSFSKDVDTDMKTRREDYSRVTKLLNQPNLEFTEYEYNLLSREEKAFFWRNGGKIK